MKIVGLGGLVLGAFVFIILALFVFCCLVISGRDDGNKKK